MSGVGGWKGAGGQRRWGHTASPQGSWAGWPFEVSRAGGRGRVKGRGRVALPRTEAAPRRSRDLDQGSVPAEMIPNKSTRGPSAGSPPQSGG